MVSSRPVCMFAHISLTSPIPYCVPFSAKPERLGILLTRCGLSCLCTYADCSLLAQMSPHPRLTLSSCQNLVCHFFPETILLPSSSLLSKHFFPLIAIILNLFVSMFCFNLYWRLQDMVVSFIFASPYHHEMCLQLVLDNVY